MRNASPDSMNRSLADSERKRSTAAARRSLDPPMPALRLSRSSSTRLHRFSRYHSFFASLLPTRILVLRTIVRAAIFLFTIYREPARFFAGQVLCLLNGFVDNCDTSERVLRGAALWRPPRWRKVVAAGRTRRFRTLRPPPCPCARARVERNNGLALTPTPKTWSEPLMAHLSKKKITLRKIIYLTSTRESIFNRFK